MRRSTEIGGIFDSGHQGHLLQNGYHLQNTSSTWSTPPIDSEYYLAGRTALTAILSKITIDAPTTRLKQAYVPSYCCESMLEPFWRAGFTTVPYNVDIDDTGRIRYDIDPEFSADVFLATSYFGYNATSMDYWIKWFSQRSVTTIEDVSHRWLSRWRTPRGTARFTFASVRKWIPCAGGGCAWALDPNERLEPASKPPGRAVHHGQTAMDLKAEYLASSRPSETLKSIFRAHSEAQIRALTDDYMDRSVDKMSLSAINRASWPAIRAARLSNAIHLADSLMQLDSAQLRVWPVHEEEDCPLFVPLFLERERRDHLAIRLREQNVYAPIHWPVPASPMAYKTSSRPYDCELSLICDQRYDLRDMDRIIKIVEEFAKDG